MPSRWWIPLHLADPSGVRPEHLHAAVSAWFDEGDDEHAARVKPYAISPAGLGPDGGTGFELATLTEAARQQMTQIAADRPHLRLGARRLIGFDAPVLIMAEEWADLRQPSGRRVWELEFATPVSFRRQNRSTPLPVPTSVLHGLAESWDAFSPKSRHPFDRSQHAAVWVSGLDGHSETLTLSGVRMSGFLGRVCFRCDEPDVADAVDGLFRLAPYAGVGSAKAKGLGVTRLLPERRPSRVG